MDDSVSTSLKQARVGKKISLEQVARATHIKIHFLEAIESGDYERLPSKAQGRGFVRIYAAYLGLNPDELLTQLEEGSVTAAAVQTPESIIAGKESNFPSKAKTILKEIGSELNRQREGLGFSLDDVELSIHIRQHYVRALEDGKLDELPSPVQGRGMLQNYATFLGLDPEPLLLAYAEALQARLKEKQSSQPDKTPPKSTPKKSKGLTQRFLPLEYIIGGILVIALVGFVIWSTLRLTSSAADNQPTETIPSIASALLVTPADTTADVALETPLSNGMPTQADALNTQTILETEQSGATETIQTTTPVVSFAPVQINLSILQRAYLRVIVDGEVEFQGRVIPGGAYNFSGQEKIEVLTGNGSAIQVLFNGTDQGVLGFYGEVVDRVYTPQGAVLPTPTITSTPTVTPLPSQTPTPTAGPTLVPLP